MNCTLGVHEANTGREWLPDKNPQAELAQQVRNRQAAVVHLQAAALTENAAARDLLRRRAAELISPRPGPRRPRRTC